MSSQGETQQAEHVHHKSCLEKHWKENSDFFKVENSIVCHDGESIQVRLANNFIQNYSKFEKLASIFNGLFYLLQGSHVTSHSGTYVLQWKFVDRPTKPAQHTHSPLDVIDSITTQHHKAKIMYYYEV